MADIECKSQMMADISHAAKPATYLSIDSVFTEFSSLAIYIR